MKRIFTIVAASGDFSIIIPSWNNLPFLQKCIFSIRNHSAGKHQIIVHANEGSDGTLEWLQSENILYTHSRDNIGICAAFNCALKRAEKQFVLYLNDDMYVLPGWDEALTQVIPESSLWMLSSTMIEPHESGNACVIVADYGDALASFREDDLLNEFAGLQKNDWSGASWPPVLLPRQLWESVGGFSEEYFPGMYSDPDLAMKLWQKGVRYFRGAGSSRVYHFQSKSTQRILQNNGRLLFMKKWGVTPSFFYREYLQMGQPWRGASGKLPNFSRIWLNRLRVSVQTYFL
ncbi:MAG TPA: glycosyltransferase [Chitinophagales bacterium]|nr:glycosyltransferase [Chitinophagales bacterium]